MAFFFPFLLHHWSLAQLLPSHLPLTVPGLAWAESGPAAGQVQGHCHCFSKPREGGRATTPGLSSVVLELSSSCLHQLPGQWPGFCLLLSEQTFPSSRLGHFLKTLSSWLTVLASCFRPRCLAQPCPVKWLSRLSSSVLPASGPTAWPALGPLASACSLCVALLL